MSALAETWLLLFLLAAGLGLGGALVLALGRLLADDWLDPLHPPLATLARWGPALALLLALPMGWLAPSLWPWAAEGAARNAWHHPGFVHARTLAALALWTWLGWRLAAGGSRGWGGAALLTLLLTGALLMDDWALSRDPEWSGSVQGLALLAEQAAAALALAALASGLPRDDSARTGLERALLALALAVLWLWFTQYLVVYAADIPAEAAWYLRRLDGAWRILKVGIALPALLGAIALAIVPQWGRWRLRAVGALLLLHHLAHLVWVVRPEARATSPELDGLAAVVALALLGAVALRRA